MSLSDIVHPVITANVTIYDDSIADVYPINANAGNITVTFAPPTSFASKKITLINVSTVFNRTLTIVATGVTTTTYSLLLGPEKFIATSDGAKWYIEVDTPNQQTVAQASAVTGTTTWSNSTFPADGACVPITVGSAYTLTLPLPSAVDTTQGPRHAKLLFIATSTFAFTIAGSSNITGVIASTFTSNIAKSGASSVTITGPKAGDELLLGTDGTTWFIWGAVAGIAS